VTGFDEVTIEPCEVRLEAGLPLAGLLASARTWPPTRPVPV